MEFKDSKVDELADSAERLTVLGLKWEGLVEPQEAVDHIRTEGGRSYRTPGGN